MLGGVVFGRKPFAPSATARDGRDGSSSPLTLRDVTAGDNGRPAGVGFDLVTGLGSWTGDSP